MYKIIICHSTVLILDLEVAAEIRASDHFLMSLVISDISDRKDAKAMKGKNTLNICRIFFFSPVKGTQSHTSHSRYAQENSALEHLHTLFPQASLLPLLPSSHFA